MVKGIYRKAWYGGEEGFGRKAVVGNPANSNG